MAPNQILAVYVFKSADLADHALDQLWRTFSGGFERSSGYEVWISSSCSDAYLAGQICQSLGGVAK